MAYQQLKPDSEQMEEMLFPEKGIDVHYQEEMRTPDTTGMGNNVRAYESLTQRNRGGMRAGITKYMQGQVSGTNLIQHITSITTTSGEALSWAFEGIDFGDAGYLGIDDGPAGFSGVPDGPPFGGGGGYQPSNSFQNDRNLALALTPDVTTMPADGSTTSVTVAAERQTGAVAIGVTVTLHTNPSGRPGDGVAILTDSVGEAIFTVSDTIVESVDYTGTSGTAVSNTESINYTGTPSIALVQDTGSFGGADPVATFTFTANVKAGSLIIIPVLTLSVGSGKTVTLSDSLGNTYQQAAGYAEVESVVSPGTFLNVSLWYAVGSSAGPCTVTVTRSGGAPYTFAPIGGYEYKNAVAFDSASSNTGTAAATFTTGSINVNFANSLIFSVIRDLNGAPAGFTYNAPAVGLNNGTAQILPTGSTQAVTATPTNPSPNQIYAAVGASFSPP